ncbi:Mitochondrial peroxiredoxin PRX1 [Fusarium oxysporum f. sp. cubense race 1]|uniref:Mitochondrial peroxiredoxin PRX1 n=1 Tax=Fusarium oxysporum f. sp. cubense (strain race 1) TaxID=1229664 RepID=N4TI45_FUSC1|nr:Mitochondrial peroxiredoxin PRX1 [Fusarium oxysporum f. sp. cubense race 1]
MALTTDGWIDVHKLIKNSWTIGVVTPIDWQVGEDVIVPPSISMEDAKKKFGDVREVKPYLRFTKA